MILYNFMHWFVKKQTVLLWLLHRVKMHTVHSSGHLIICVKRFHFLRALKKSWLRLS